MAVLQQQHRFVPKLLCFHLRLSREWMSTGDREEQFILAEKSLSDQRVIGVSGNERGVELTARGALHEVLGDVFDDAQRGAWIRLFHRLKHWAELIGCDGGDHAQRDCTWHLADLQRGLI